MNNKTKKEKPIISFKKKFGYILSNDLAGHYNPVYINKKMAPKCAMCKEPFYDSRYYETCKMPIREYNLDGRISGKHESGIIECPHCHYCNYKLDYLVDPSYEKYDIKERLLRWNRCVKEFLDEKNNELRKVLILESEYRFIEYAVPERVKLLIEASWVCDDERASEFRNKAINIYLKNRWKYECYTLKVIDTLRQENEFDQAEELLNLIKDPSCDKPNFEAERVLLNNKDNKPYTCKEVEEKYKQE